jgi:hypothetical protein
LGVEGIGFCNDDWASSNLINISGSALGGDMPGSIFACDGFDDGRLC